MPAPTKQNQPRLVHRETESETTTLEAEIMVLHALIRQCAAVRIVGDPDRKKVATRWLLRLTKREQFLRSFATMEGGRN